MKGGQFKALVNKIVENGKYGPYAVAHHDELGWVTFSLEAKVWKERSRPEPGTFVLLFDVRQTSGGWKATRSRFYRPADDLYRKQ